MFMGAVEYSRRLGPRVFLGFRLSWPRVTKREPRARWMFKERLDVSPQLDSGPRGGLGTIHSEPASQLLRLSKKNATTKLY